MSDESVSLTKSHEDIDIHYELSDCINYSSTPLFQSKKGYDNMPTLDTQNNVAHMNRYDILAFEDDDDDSILIEDTQRNTRGASALDMDPTITTILPELKPISQPSIPDLFIVKFDAQELPDEETVHGANLTSQNQNEQRNKPTFATTTTDTFSLA